MKAPEVDFQREKQWWDAKVQKEARGGSPDGARLVVRARTPWEQYAAEARRIAGITAELADPTPANK